MLSITVQKFTGLGIKEKMLTMQERKIAFTT